MHKTESFVFPIFNHCYSQKSIILAISRKVWSMDMFDYPRSGATANYADS